MILHKSMIRFYKKYLVSDFLFFLCKTTNAIFSFSFDQISFKLGICVLWMILHKSLIRFKKYLVSEFFFLPNYKNALFSLSFNRNYFKLGWFYTKQKYDPFFKKIFSFWFFYWFVLAKLQKCYLLTHFWSDFWANRIYHNCK